MPKNNGKHNGDELTHIGDIKVLTPEGDIKPDGGKRKKAEPSGPKESTRFWKAPEVETIANQLVNQGRLPHLSVLRQAKILFLFTNAERLTDENIAHAHRFNATYAYMPGLEHDFVLKVSKPQWDRTPDELRPAIVYHFLLHFDSDSMGRWRIAPHDFEGFVSELEQFPESTWQEGMKKARQLGLFDTVAQPEVVDKREPALR